MPEFINRGVPFTWIPQLEPGYYLAAVNTEISAYPDYYPIYGNVFYGQTIYFHWIEGSSPQRILSPRYRINYRHQRIYAPYGARPTGIYIWAPGAIQLSGSAELGFDLNG